MRTKVDPRNYFEMTGRRSASIYAVRIDWLIRIRRESRYDQYQLRSLRVFFERIHLSALKCGQNYD